MSTTTTADQLNAAEGAGSEIDGEPKGSVNGQGEPGEKEASAKGEPGAEGLFDGMDAPTLHKSYKKLQGEYGRLQNDIIKKFEPYGGPEQVLQWTEYLAKNPDFAQWITQQKTKSALGVDETQLDDQTKAALGAVRKIAQSVVEDEIRKLRTQELAPLSEASKQQLIASHFDLMDKRYGAEWHEMRDLMSELSDGMPQELQDRPTFDDVEDLYFKALRKSGKLESFAAKKLQQQIKDKKGKSTDKPAATGDAGSKKATSIAEAFRMAKEQA